MAMKPVVRHVIGLLVAAVTAGLLGFVAGYRAAPKPVSPSPAPQPVPPAQPATDPADDINLRAEFNPQAALLVGANEMVRYHPRTFLELVSAVPSSVPVFGLVSSHEEREIGVKLLAESGVTVTNLLFLEIPGDSMWLRDYGPMFVRRRNAGTYIVDADYSNVDNATERWRDNDMPILFGNILGLDVRSIPLRMEGGNLLSNGDGLCISTLSIYNRNRQRGYTLEQVGGLLRDYFGFREWLYLRRPQSEATGHVDMFVTMLRRNLALVAKAGPGTSAEDAALLDEAAELLARQQTRYGAIRVYRIPLPPPFEEMWRTYNNVVMINGHILVPSFSDVDPALQEEAYAMYRSLMPSWKVVPINCDSLSAKRGLLRCCTIGIPETVDVSALQQMALAQVAP